MTKREALRRVTQAQRLQTLGFTLAQADQLRRISVTLSRWYELECGTDSACLVRGRLVDGEFQYDERGQAFWEFAGVSGRGRYSRTADRERGAIKRLEAIMRDRQAEPATLGVSYYLQTDPRGCALYILRPGDVAEGADVSACYSNGIAVY
jgi:hypothetical protein